MHKPQIETVDCFTCGSLLGVDDSPVLVYVSGGGQQFRPPRFTAPFICEVCREQPTKLKAARTEMFKYIGPEQTREGFDG